MLDKLLELVHDCTSVSRLFKCTPYICLALYDEETIRNTRYNEYFLFHTDIMTSILTECKRAVLVM